MSTLNQYTGMSGIVAQHIATPSSLLAVQQPICDQQDVEVFGDDEAVEEDADDEYSDVEDDSASSVSEEELTDDVIGDDVVCDIAVDEEICESQNGDETQLIALPSPNDSSEKLGNARVNSSMYYCVLM